MKKQSGLSLVELMISVTLGLILMAGVIQMFVSTKSSYVNQQGMSRVQETGRMAMEFIGRDLRMASAMGCVRVTTPSRTTPNVIDPLAIDLGGLHRNFQVGLFGFDSPSALDAAVPLADAIGSMVPAADSDILIIRGSVTEKGFPVEVLNTVNAITVFSGASTITNNCIDGLCQGGAAVITDCDSGRIFAVRALAAAGTDLTITHNENWDMSVDVNVYERRPEVFVYPLHTIVYFVAPGASGEPSLWQRTDRDTAMEVVEGVERIQFTYRTSRSAVATFVAGSALSAADWEDVDAVRVDMVVRGAEPNALETPQFYTFPGDAAETDPDDRRIRQIFTNTFSVRNRNNAL